MSTAPEPQVDPRALDLERKRLSQRLEELSKLCESDVPPGVFYGELLKKLLESLAAPVGALGFVPIKVIFSCNSKSV